MLTTILISWCLTCCLPSSADCWRYATSALRRMADVAGGLRLVAAGRADWSPGRRTEGFAVAMLALFLFGQGFGPGAHHDVCSELPDLAAGVGVALTRR
jgi:hypothetical protein